MNKNTVWFIVLSVLIIIASYLLLPRIFPSLQMTPLQKETNEITESESFESNESEVVQLDTFLYEDSNEGRESENSDVATEETLSEQTFVVNTNYAEIVLTNKGGDIISYKLKKHYDMETETGVQLADNISNLNRTCALSIGGADKAIVNTLFALEQIDEYTYLFKQNLKINGRNVMVGKKYTFKPDEYIFKLDVLFHDSEGKGLNFDGTSYTLRTSPQIGPHFNSKSDRYENRSFLAFNGKKVKKINVGTKQFKKYDKDAAWTAIGGKYFLQVVIPVQLETINSYYYSSLVEVDNYANAQDLIERKSFNGSDIQDSYYFYFGPRNDDDLKRYNVSDKNDWALSGLRLNEGLQTYDWLKWLEKILKFFLELIYKVVRNWGVAIIILTIILKFAMFPLSKKQSMGSLKMQELQPKMQAIQEKYKNDQQKLQQETQKLYQQAGYNPATGCLPMVFQFLILFAMFDLFNNYFEFRGAMFIPGWIPDLSRGDHVATLKFTIPLLQTNELRILPIIYVATQLLYGKVTQNGGLSAGNSQNQMTMKFMTYGMPFIFFFIFYSAPAGLIIYWTISNVFQMVQQVIINKMMNAKKEEIKSKENNNQTLPPKAKSKQNKKK